MTAERRYSARHPIRIEVQILYRGRRFLTACGMDLSLQGLWLTVRNLTLPIGTQIQLEMDCLGRIWRVDAVVVHRNRSGVGVMFREPQQALYEGLTHQAPDLQPPPARSPPRPRLIRS